MTLFGVLVNDDSMQVVAEVPCDQSSDHQCTPCVTSAAQRERTWRLMMGTVVGRVLKNAPRGVPVKAAVICIHVECSNHISVAVTDTTWHDMTLQLALYSSRHRVDVLSHRWSLKSMQTVMRSKSIDERITVTWTSVTPDQCRVQFLLSSLRWDRTIHWQRHWTKDTVTRWIHHVTSDYQCLSQRQLIDSICRHIHTRRA